MKSAIPANCADALLEFGDRYIRSKTGNIPHQQLPEPLQEGAMAVACCPNDIGRSETIAKIPSVSQDGRGEE